MINEVIERTRTHIFESQCSIDSEKLVFTWDFGDGTSNTITTDNEIAHVFNAKGTYTISVSADFSESSIYRHTTGILPRDELSVYVVTNTFDILVIPTLSDFLDQGFDLDVNTIGIKQAVPLSVGLTDTTLYGDDPPLDVDGYPEYVSVETWSTSACPNPVIESVTYDTGDGAVIRQNRAQRVYYKSEFGVGTDDSRFPVVISAPFATITGIGTLKYTVDGTEPSLTNGIEVATGTNVYIPPTTSEFKLISLNTSDDVQGRAIYQFVPDEFESDKTFNYVFREEGKYNIKQTVQAVYTVVVNGEEQQIVLTGNVVKSIEATPFFETWFYKHLDSKFYDHDSKGFQDFAQGVGHLYDRVFNDLTSIVDLIDFKKIKDEYIVYLFQTYGDYEEIAKKIGFNAYTETITDGSRYEHFENYNVFQRIIDGEALPREKSEFLEYLKNTVGRLKTRGTVKSIIDNLNRYQFTAKFIELWTDNFNHIYEKKDDLVDIGFQTKNLIDSNTGLNFHSINTSDQDNAFQIIIPGKTTPYLYVDSTHNFTFQYYSSGSTTRAVGGTDYAVFENTIDVRHVDGFDFSENNSETYSTHTSAAFQPTQIINDLVDIDSIYVDRDELFIRDAWIYGVSGANQEMFNNAGLITGTFFVSGGDLYVPINELEYGDKITVVYKSLKDASDVGSVFYHYDYENTEIQASDWEHIPPTQIQRPKQNYYYVDLSHNLNLFDIDAYKLVVEELTPTSGSPTSGSPQEKHEIDIEHEALDADNIRLFYYPTNGVLPRLNVEIIPIRVPQIASLMSINKEEVYLNTRVEAEIEFPVKTEDYEQQFELVVRAHARHGTKYDIDSYFSFGFKNGKVYLCKSSYHPTSTPDTTYNYTQLINLNTGTLTNDDIETRYFNFINPTIRSTIGIQRTRKFDSGKRYRFIAKIENNLASFYIQKVKEDVFSGVKYPELVLFENVELDSEFVTFKDTLLENDIAIPPASLPYEEIEGFVGINIKNSIVRIYEYGVYPLENNKQINLYKLEDVYKKLRTAFNNTYASTQPIKYNSTTSTQSSTLTDAKIATYVEGEQTDMVGSFNVSSKSAIDKVYLNHFQVEEGRHYETGFVYLENNLPKAYEGSKISVKLFDSFDVGDSKMPSHHGIEEINYFIAIADGNSNTFQLSDEFINRVSLNNKFRFVDVIIPVEDYEYEIIRTADPVLLSPTESVKDTGNRIRIKETFEIDRNNLNDNLKKYQSTMFYLRHSIKTRGNILTQLGYPEASEQGWIIHPKYLDILNIKGTDVEKQLFKMRAEIVTYHRNFTCLFNDPDVDLMQDFPDALDYTDLAALSGQFVPPMSGVGDFDATLFKKHETIEWSAFESYIEALVENQVLTEFQEGIRFVSGENIDTSYFEFLADNGLAKLGDSPILADDKFLYRAYDKESYTLDLENKRIVFDSPLPAGMEIYIKYEMDNMFTLTDAYNTEDLTYRIPEKLQELNKMQPEKYNYTSLVATLPARLIKKFTVGDKIFYLVNTKKLGNVDMFESVSIPTDITVDRHTNVRRTIDCPLRNMSDIWDRFFLNKHHNKYLRFINDIISKTLTVNNKHETQRLTKDANGDLQATFIDPNLVYGVMGPDGGIDENFSKECIFRNVIPGGKGFLRKDVAIADAPYVKDGVNVGQHGSAIDSSYFEKPTSGKFSTNVSVPQFFRNHHGLFCWGDHNDADDFSKVDFYNTVNNVYPENNVMPEYFNDVFMQWLESYQSKANDFGKELDHHGDPNSNDWEIFFLDMSTILFDSRSQSTLDGASINNNYITNYAPDTRALNGDIYVYEFFQNRDGSLIRDSKTGQPKSKRRLAEIGDSVVIEQTEDSRYSETLMGTRSEFSIDKTNPDLFVERKVFSVCSDDIADDNVTNLFTSTVDRFNDFRFRGVQTKIGTDFTRISFNNHILFDQHKTQYLPTGTQVYVTSVFKDEVANTAVSDVLVGMSEGKTQEIFIKPQSTNLKDRLSKDFKFSNFMVIDVDDSSKDYVIDLGIEFFARPNELAVYKNDIKLAKDDVIYVSSNNTNGTHNRSVVAVDTDTITTKFALMGYSYNRGDVISVERTGIERNKINNVVVDNFVVDNDWYGIDFAGGSTINFFKEVDITTNTEIYFRFNINELFESTVENVFVDDFKSQRQLKWATLFRDVRGYAVTPYFQDSDSFLYVIDENKVPGNVILKRQDLVAPIYTTVSGTEKSGAVVAVHDGKDFNDIIYLVTNYKKKNKFELQVDLYFDADTPQTEMKSMIIFKGVDEMFQDRFFLSKYYYVGVGFQDKNLIFGSKGTDRLGNAEDNMYAYINDKSTVIEREKWYTLRVKYIDGVVKIYLHERNELPVLYITYDIMTGEITVGEQSLVSEIRETTNTVYLEPINTHTDGDQFGLYSPSSKCYFANFKYVSYEASNLRYGEVFGTNPDTEMLRDIEHQFNIGEQIRDIRKVRTTLNNVVLFQLGNTLFAKSGGRGTFFRHDMDVNNFEVIGEQIYVVERGSQLQENDACGVDSPPQPSYHLSVYKNELSYTETPNVASKVFQEEPFTVYLDGFGQSINDIQRSDHKLYVFTEPQATFCASGNISSANEETAESDIFNVTMNVLGTRDTQVYSNAEGNYIATGLYEGTYDIIPQKNGYKFVPTSIVVALSANVTDMDFLIVSELYGISGEII